MIRCYYKREELEIIARAARNRVVYIGGFMLLWCLVIIIGGTWQDPTVWFRPKSVGSFLLFMSCFWGMLYFMHYLLTKIDRTTLAHDGDIIVLDDENIRLSQGDGTEIVLPRGGLRVSCSWHATGRTIFKIRNYSFIDSPTIVLTTDMENAVELVNTIQPNVWNPDQSA